MSLRMLMVEATKENEKRDGIYFRWTALHVKELLLLALPRPFELDGSSKLTVICGPHKDDARYAHLPQYHRLLGGSAYFVDGFDFQAYTLALPEGRELVILEVLERCLSDVARQNGRDSEPIRHAAATVKEWRFRRSVYFERLSKKYKPRELQLLVYRHLSREDGETWSVRVLDRTDAPLGEVYLCERPSYVQYEANLRRTVIEAGRIVIKNGQGGTVLSADLSGFL